MFFQGKTSQNIACKMSAILSQPHCVNPFFPIQFTSLESMKEVHNLFPYNLVETPSCVTNPFHGHGPQVGQLIVGHIINGIISLDLAFVNLYVLIFIRSVNMWNA